MKLSANIKQELKETILSKLLTDEEKLKFVLQYVEIEVLTQVKDELKAHGQRMEDVISGTFGVK